MKLSNQCDVFEQLITSVKNSNTFFSSQFLQWLLSPHIRMTAVHGWPALQLRWIFALILWKTRCGETLCFCSKLISVWFDTDAKDLTDCICKGCERQRPEGKPPPRPSVTADMPRGLKQYTNCPSRWPSAHTRTATAGGRTHAHPAFSRQWKINGQMEKDDT